MALTIPFLSKFNQLFLIWREVKSSRIGIYSTAHSSDAVYIIGGIDSPSIVAEFKDDKWRRLDNLNQKRDGHGSITVEGQTMIVGGYRTIGE